MDSGIEIFVRDDQSTFVRGINIQSIQREDDGSFAKFFDERGARPLGPFAPVRKIKFCFHPPLPRSAVRPQDHFESKRKLSQ